MILFAAAILLAVIVLLVSYVCFRMGFYADRRKDIPADIIDLPEGPVYEPFRPMMEQWLRETLDTPHEHVTIKSFDGLTLHGNYYEFAPGAPIELMFHGYRGSANRDLCGGMQRCFQLGRSALIVDQRASTLSDGKIISFGINEHRDCLAWVQFAIGHFGGDVKLILTGISMGAATVMLAAGKPLPKNVIGILADCGYTSAKDIIMKVVKEMGLPPRLSYPFIRLGAKIFGHFDLEEDSPKEALKRCRLPVIFFHGESDDYVPCYMSRENYEVCASRKKLVTIPGAGHGLSFPKEQERYLKELWEFFGPEASHPSAPISH